MNKFKLLIDRIREHDNFLKVAAAITVVMVAVLFFVLKGENKTITVDNAETLTEEESGLDEKRKNTNEEVYVDIDGAIKNPGVYKVNLGCRIFEIVNKAGGLTDDADTTTINQAEAVVDGQKIIIPHIGENTYSTNINQEGTNINGLININYADLQQLQEIPGVGPSTAEKIIAYRESNGNFNKKEDIKNISGIGAKTYEKMESKITV